jgi:hypothetical protein
MIIWSSESCLAQVLEGRFIRSCYCYCMTRLFSIPHGSATESRRKERKKRGQPQHQPDIWGLTKGMLQTVYILLVKTIPFLVQQNVGLVQSKSPLSSSYDSMIILWYGIYLQYHTRFILLQSSTIFTLQKA